MPARLLLNTKRGPHVGMQVMAEFIRGSSASGTEHFCVQGVLEAHGSNTACRPWSGHVLRRSSNACKQRTVLCELHEANHVLPSRHSDIAASLRYSMICVTQHAHCSAEVALIS